MGNVKISLFLLQIFLFKSWCDSSATPLVPFHAASLARGGLKHRTRHDLCSHPFHSWMCEKNSRKGKSFSADSNKSNGRNSFQEPVSFKPTKPAVTPSALQTTLPVKSTTPKQSSFPKDQETGTTNLRNEPLYIKCSPPFHDWLCDSLRKLSTVINLPESPTTKSMTIEASRTLLTVAEQFPNSSKSSPQKRGKILFAGNNRSSTTELPSLKLKDNYDPCSHPFHSWMCSNPSLKRKGVQNPSNSGKSLFPESIRTTTTNRPSIEKATKRKSIPTENPFATITHQILNLKREKKLFTSNNNPLPSKILSMKPREKYDKCSHSFHSWMCSNSSEKSKQLPNKASNNSGKSLFPQVFTTTTARTIPSFRTQKPKVIKTTKSNPFQSPKTFTTPRSNVPTTKQTKLLFENNKNLPTTMKPKDSYDKCSHAFHSWMCSRQSPKTKPMKNRSPSNSGKSLFPVSFTTTTRKPVTVSSTDTHLPKILTTPRSKVTASKQSRLLFGSNQNLPTTQMPSVKSKEKYDKCSHAFHSWMCSRPPPKRKQLENKSPSNLGKSLFTESIFTTTVKPVTVPFLSTHFPKILTTPRSMVTAKQSKLLFKSNQNLPTTRLPSMKPKEKYDKCSHAFHSWMCSRPSPKRKPIENRAPNNSGKSLFPGSITTASVKPFTVPFFTTVLPKILTTSIAKQIVKPSDVFPKKTSIPKHVENTFSINRRPLPNTTLKPEEKYDKCFHAFHSWMCSKPSQQRKSLGNTAQTNRGKSFSLKRGNSPNAKISVTQPPKPSKNKENSYDMCSHAFHSWLCQKSPSSRNNKTVKSTNNSPNKAKSFSAKNKSDAPVRKIKTKDETHDKCNHPFHSLLCNTTSNSRNPKNTNPKISFPPSLNIPKSLKVKPIIENPRNKTTLKPDKYDRCNHPFHSWQCKSTHRAQNNKNVRTHSIPKTVVTPLKSSNLGKSLLRTPFQNPKSKVLDPNFCSNPFHAWRCSSNQKSLSPQNPKSKGSFVSPERVDPPNLTTTSKPKNKVDTPLRFNKMFKKKENSSWEGANPCSHAFHRWLCQSLRPRVTNSARKVSTTIPFINIKRSLKVDITTPLPVTNKPISASSNISIKKSSFCGHPFHTSLCGKNINKESRPSETNRDQKRPSSSRNSKTPFPTEFENKIKQSKLTPDYCNHPFHSWVCDRTFGNRITTVSPSLIPNIRSLPLEGEK